MCRPGPTTAGSLPAPSKKTTSADALGGTATSMTNVAAFCRPSRVEVFSRFMGANNYSALAPGAVSRIRRVALGISAEFQSPLRK